MNEMKILNKINKVIHIYTGTVKRIARNIHYLVVGQGLIMGFAYFLLFPFVSKVFGIALKLTGNSYITAGNIGKFLIHPITIGTNLVLFFVIGLFLTFDIIFLIIFFSATEREQKLNPVMVVKLTIYRWFYCLKIGKGAAILTSWILSVLSCVPFILFSMWRFRIFQYYIEEAPERFLILGFGVAVVVLVIYLYFWGPYYFHSLLAKKNGLLTVSRKDVSYKERRKALLYIIGWNILLTCFLFIIYAFTMLITTLLVSGFADKVQATATFIEVYDSMSVYLALIMFVISITVNMALTTYLYHRHRKLKINGQAEAEEFFKPAYPYKKIVYFLLVTLFCINFYYFYQVVRNGSALDYMNLEAIQVTSHRGYSHSVPENTLIAIEKAIEEQADYVEVDVRVTEDGELVLMHDASLKRTTGLNKYVWNTTYEEISQLDAGSWFSRDFAGTSVPTVRELFELSKGKVLINLDLKYRNDKEELAEKVVELIKEYDMQLQCVITSTSLRCLKQVKEAEEEIRTGYITYGLYPSLYNNTAVDFFSMKANLVTKNIVNEAHKRGKKIHVWTVNSRKEIERLQRLGVDNIITDNPSYAKQILHNDESDKFLATLLKIIKD